MTNKSTKKTNFKKKQIAICSKKSVDKYITSIVYSSSNLRYSFSFDDKSL